MSTNYSPLASAIGNAEGYGIPGAIPTLANNPGDLVLGDQGYGTMGNGITVFPTSQAGQDALVNQINLITSGKSSVYTPDESLAQVGNTWSNGDPNWASNVASDLGVSPSTPISSVTSSPFSWEGIKQLWSGLLGTESVAGLPIANSSGQVLNAPNPSVNNAWLTRGVVIALGLIIITAGLFMLKSTQAVIRTVGNTTKKAVELTA